MRHSGEAPRVGVGVLVVDRGRALLSRRLRPPEPGRWGILGGRLELFETLEMCAVREVREEAGIGIVLQGLLCVTDHIILEEAMHWVAPAFLAKHIEGVPVNREPERAADLAWFSLDALPAPLTITAARAIRAFLDQENSLKAVNWNR